MSQSTSPAIVCTAVAGDGVERVGRWAFEHDASTAAQERLSQPG